MKNLIANFLLLGFGVCVGLLIAEGCVRLFFPHPSYGAPKGLYRLNKDRDYELAPNFKGIFRSPEFYSHIITNSHGLRDREYESKTEDVFRIMIIGDSFTFGHGCELEDSFTKILESNLNESSYKDYKYVEVVNAGVGGYGVDHYYLHLKEMFGIYKPDLVVLSFFIGNDIGPRLGLRTVWDGYLVDKNSIPFRNQVKGEIASLSNGFLKMKALLAQHSHLFNFIVTKVKHSRKIKAFFNSTGMAAGEEFKKIKNLALQEKKKEYDKKKERNKNVSTYFQKYLMTPTLLFEKDWQYSRNLIEKISLFLSERNVEFFIAFLPDRMQVHKEYWGNVLWQQNFDQNDFNLENINKRFSDFCTTKSIGCVDMLPEFKKQAQSDKRLYFKNDAHWNSVGHRLAADILTSSLKKILEN